MRIIDVDELKAVPLFSGQYDNENANEDFILGIETVMEFIDSLTAVDAVPVVLCKDCKYSGDFDEFGVAICKRKPRYGHYTTRKRRVLQQWSADRSG